MNAREAAFFIATDAEDEPTLWMTGSILHEYPLPVVRRCDLTPGTRYEGWAFIEAAITAALDTTVHHCHRPPGHDEDHSFSAGHGPCDALAEATS